MATPTTARVFLPIFYQMGLGKIQKTMVNYQESGVVTALKCYSCQWFIPNEYGLFQSRCRIVDGDIKPEATCLAFFPLLAPTQAMYGRLDPVLIGKSADQEYTDAQLHSPYVPSNQPGVNTQQQ